MRLRSSIFASDGILCSYGTAEKMDSKSGAEEHKSGKAEDMPPKDICMMPRRFRKRFCFAADRPQIVHSEIGCRRRKYACTCVPSEFLCVSIMRVHVRNQILVFGVILELCTKKDDLRCAIFSVWLRIGILIFYTKKSGLQAACLFSIVFC